MPSAPRASGTWVMGASFGGCELAGVHGYVGGAEVDLLGADRGDARAAAHGGIGHGDRGVLLVVSGQERGGVRRTRPVRVPGPPPGPPLAAVLVVVVVLQRVCRRAECPVLRTYGGCSVWYQERTSSRQRR